MLRTSKEHFTRRQRLYNKMWKYHLYFTLLYLFNVCVVPRCTVNRFGAQEKKVQFLIRNKNNELEVFF